MTGTGISGQKNFGQFGPTVLVQGTPVSFGSDYDPPGAVFIDGYFMATITDTPEPATLAILGAGLVGLGLARKRKRA